MPLLPIPTLRDNYTWLLHDENGHAMAVDPGEAAPVQAELEQRKLKLEHILLTHHHADHIGGSVELARQTGARIIAPHDARIAHAEQRVSDGEHLHLQPAGWRFTVLEVPGHTRSHVAYFGEGIVFSGDTLFSLGCGRLFEGSPSEMLDSLDRLSALPDDTLLCCGHEYTLDNAAFALSVDPDNPALRKRMAQAQVLRGKASATLPSRMQEERQCNPFLRIDSEAICSWARQHVATEDRIKRFATLRAAKDHFTP